MHVLGVILAISLLVIIHEFGHYIVARAFGMRVLTYSIGFGPVIARWRPRGSETVFQIAAVPLLAYVQIAGMNPRDTVDPNDRGSYQNASPVARFLTIAAGPLANYVAAGLALFLLLWLGGEPAAPTLAQLGRVDDNTPAAAAGLRPDDVIRQINGAPVQRWEDVLHAVRGSNGHALEVTVDRAGHSIPLHVTPRLNPTEHVYQMGVVVKTPYESVPFATAVKVGLVGPAVGTAHVLEQIGGMFRHKVPVQLVGPVGIVTEGVHQAKAGWRSVMEFVASVSISLFIFNLLPIPALDGGRLVVLGYEMAFKRRPNPQIEARVLAASIMLMLGLFLIVTSRELWGLISGLFKG